jgi:hypothetical protein
MSLSPDDDDDEGNEEDVASGFSSSAGSNPTISMSFQQQTLTSFGCTTDNADAPSLEVLSKTRDLQSSTSAKGSSYVALSNVDSQIDSKNINSFGWSRYFSARYVDERNPRGYAYCFNHQTGESRWMEPGQVSATYAIPSAERNPQFYFDPKNIDQYVKLSDGYIQVNGPKIEYFADQRKRWHGFGPILVILSIFHGCLLKMK